jgi:CheY-like chemotaxis protein
MASLLARTELTAQQRNLLGTMEQSGKALLAVINDVLDLSRIEAGRLQLDLEPFSLSDCIGDAASILAPEAKAKGLTLDVHLSPGLPDTACGDAGRLRQVLINLLGNAVKFTAHGSVSLDARVVGETPNGYRIGITVTDTGIGMAPATAERLFRPFEQGDGSITRRFGGTGLGLSITNSIVALMQGTIRIESALGKGTTVTFEVLLGRASPVLPSAKTHGAAGTAGVVPTLDGLRVLVAEDNPVNQEVALAFLEGLGCNIRLVEDGAQAVEAYRAERFDAVMMDCQMPTMDGLTATREIRALEAARGIGPIPIIAVTANAFDSDRAACLAAGMDDFLSKPFSQASLAAMLAKWNDGQRRAEVA